MEHPSERDSLTRAAGEPDGKEKTRRALNVPLLVGTLLAAAILGPGAYAWRSYQVNCSAEMFLEQTGRLEQQEKWQEAAGYLHRYLRLRPGEADVRVRLAETFDKSAGDPRQKLRAVQLYYEALGVAPAGRVHALRCRLTELLLEGGRFASAEREARRLLEQDEDGPLANAEDPAGKRLLALALDGQLRSGALAGAHGDAMQVVAALEDALRIEVNRGDVELSAALARIYRDPVRLPDRGLAALLARVYPATEEPVPGELSGLHARIVRADADPLPDDLAGILAKLDPEAAKTSDNRLSALLRAMCQAEKPPAREHERAVVKATRALLADDVMDQMAAANPDNAESYLVRYQYRGDNELPGAEQDLESALKHGPDDVAVLLAAAERAQRSAWNIEENKGSSEDVREAYDKARGYYEHAVEVERSLEAGHLGLGRVWAAQGEVEQAIEAWKRGLVHCGEASISLNSALVEALIARGQVDEAEQYLEVLDREARNLAPQLARSTRLSLNRSIDLLRGEWLVRKGEYPAAIPLLRQVTAGEVGLEAGITMARNAYLYLAAAYSALAQPDQVALSYEKAADLQPNEPEPRLNAAAAWVSAGRPGLAIGQYERALALADDPEARFGLARAQLLQQVRLAKAQRRWEPFQSALREIKKPERLESLSEAWRVPVLEAQHLVVRSREEAPDDQTSAAADATASSAKKVLDEARKVYPDSVGLLRTLAPFYDALGYAEDADTALEEFEKSAAHPADVCLVRCALHRRRGQYDEARKVLQQGISALPPEFRPAMQAQLAQISVDQGQIAQAQKELKALMKRHGNVPGAVGLLCQIAEMALQTNEFNELKECESKLLELEGARGPYWRYYKARRLLAQAKREADLDEADALRKQIESRRPTWSATDFLAGLILERRGRFEEAIEAYKEAIRLGERGISVYERLIRLVYLTQRFDEADRYLAELQESGFTSPALAPLESRIAAGRALTSPDTPAEVRREQLKRALDTARRSVKDRPDDPLEHIWLGNLLSVSSQEASGEDASRQSPEAEAEFREAVRLAPADVRTYHALFGYYLRSGQRDQAQHTIGEVEGNDSLLVHERALAVAQMYERLGEQAKAEENYREADRIAKAADTDKPSAETVAFRVTALRRRAAMLLQSDPEQATAVYREICDLVPESDSARRTLASVLALRSVGKYDQQGEQLWKEAQGLLQGAGARGGTSSTDLRLRAALLYQRGGADNLKTARELFERLAANPEDASDFDRLALARIHDAQAVLCRAEGDEPNAKEELQAARRHFTALVARDNPNGSHLLSYVEFLLRNGLDDESVPWSRKLRELATGDAQLLASYAGLMLRHEREADASPSLDELEALAPDDVQTIELRVRWLNARGETSKIEPLVESASAKLLAIAAQDPGEEAKVCLQIGTIYSAVERYDLAAQWYRRVVGLLPDKYESLAVSLARQGQTKEAIQMCNEAAERGGSAQSAVAITSVLAYGQPSAEEFQLAEPTLMQAVKEHKDSPAVLLAVANARFIGGRVNDAVELYRQVLKLRPKDVLVLNNLATLLSEQPDGREEALRCINQAIDIAGPRPALLDTKGSLLIHDDKPGEAVHCLEEAIRGSDSDPRFHLHLAIAYDRLGEAEKARDALKAAHNGNLTDEILTEGDRKVLADLQQRLGQ